MEAGSYLRAIEKAYKVKSAILPPVIGLAGKAGVGKDVAAAYISKQYEYQVYRMSDPIKRMLEAGFGVPLSVWEDRVLKEQEVAGIGRSPRYLAQTLGTQWGRNCIAPDIWITLFRRHCEAAIAEGRRIVVADVRFDNEAHSIRNLNGAILHIDRPDVAPVHSHESEYGIQARHVTARILNDYTIPTFLKRIDDTMGMLSQREAARLGKKE